VIQRVTAGNRPGLTLLEVLVAMAIFLLSLGAITRLVTFAGQRALDARRTDEAGRLARSKLAEVFAGVVPLESADDTPFDEDPDYSWSLSADSGSMSGLWIVTVTIKRKGDEGPGFSLQQFLLDPTLRGSTQDTITIAGANSSSSSNSSSPQTGSSNSASPMASGGSMPAKGKSSAPSAPAAGKGKAGPPAGSKSSSSSSKR
jgi:general secretion pathway protein I